MSTRAAPLRSLLDGACVALAVAVLLPILGYPLARDQSVFAYVAREWWSGRMPYRDVFDHKPPGIYAVYAAAHALSGVSERGVRILEIVTVVAMGALAAWCVGRDGRVRRGELGAGALLAAGWYATTFDWVCMGQPELWEGVALLAAYGAAVRVRSLRAAALVSGALVGVALLFKHPAALVAVVVALALAVRAFRAARWRALFRALGLHALGVALAIAPVVAYFVARGAGAAAYDGMLGYVLVYHHGVRCAAPAASWMIEDFWVFRDRPWVLLATGGLALAGVAALRLRRGRTTESIAWTLLLFAAAFASVLWQHRFHPYHWVVTSPFVVMAAAHGTAALARRARWLSPLAAAAAVLLGVLTGPRWYANNDVSYRSATRDFWSLATGRIDREAYLAPFTSRDGYAQVAVERLGRTIAARAKPGDGLVVRWLEPHVYLSSGLRSPSRFIYDLMFRGEALSYKREAWRREHEKAMFDPPVRFVVATAGDAADEALLTAHGYVAVAREGKWLLFEHADAAVARAPP